jgi:hypothetical protein
MTDQATAVETNAPTAMDIALQALREAKTAEAEANKTRLAAETAVINLMGELKPEGTAKAETEYFKVQVATKLNRTISDDTALAAALPAPIASRLVRYKAALDLKELRHLQDNEPELYAKAAEFITAKPAKPTVRVEVI